MPSLGRSQEADTTAQQAAAAAPTDYRTLGQPLVMTDAELDVAAAITPADLAHARQYWREQAPDPYKTLLDAKVTP